MGKKAKRPLKVLHAPLNFANQAYVLSQALRARGVDSHLLRYQWEGNDAATKFQYGEDRVAEVSRKDWFGDLLRNVQNIATEGFDIVHFWNRSLLWRRPNDVFNGMDLPFIRLAGARLAYRFTGYELRRKSLELSVNPFTPYRYGFESAFNEDDQKRYLDYLTSYIDAFVVQDPEMQTYCPQARIIPRALDLEQFPVPEPAPNKRPIVLHAPSRRSLKGSEFVIKAVDALRDEGLNFDFLVIEDMPNAEALEHYRRADIIIDQLLIGWYGVLSMEAMAMGKTVIVHIREDLTDYFRNGMPLVNANPETITAVLRNAIKDGELRRDIGRRARAFVEEVHDSRVVARSAAKLYKKMLKTPASPMIPDLSYHIGNSVNFVNTIFDAARVDNWRRKLGELRRDYNRLNAAHQVASSEATKIAVLTEQIAVLSNKGERNDELGPELPALLDQAGRYEELSHKLEVLREKAERYDGLTQALPALRHDARRYQELKAELPTMRYKSKRYDELKDVALVWRAKADRFDRFATKRWVRFLLPLLGLPLAFKSQRAHQSAAPKSEAGSRGRLRAAAGGAAGETSEDGPIGGTVPGFEQPDTASPKIVQQPFSGHTSAQDGGTTERSSVTAEIRAILRMARAAKRSHLEQAGPAAKQGVVASPTIGRQTGQTVCDKGVVCIVSRKPIRNVTRAPRMAKALVDAGYGVVVVSLARPVPQLQEMCPQVQYLEIRPRPLSRELNIRCEDFRRKRENYRAQRGAEYQAAVAKGGFRARSLRLVRVVKTAVRPVAWLSWRLFVIVPGALLLKKPSQRFAEKWRELALQDAVGIVGEFAKVQNQRSVTHGLAEAADKATHGRRFDVVQAYDNYALVAAARLAARDGAKLIYDAVELSRMGLDLNFVERMRERAERREEARIIRKSDALITVSDGLADRSARHYHRLRPMVVRNCRYYWIYRADARLRADAGVGPEVRLLVWVGSLYPQQGIETLIKALPHLAPHIHAVIIGFFQPRWRSYVQEALPALAASFGVADRVHFLPAREPNDIVSYISGADIGVIPGSRQQPNYFFGMPNKFLEMIMARLPIATSRVRDMVDLINKYEIGGVFDERDPTNIAAVIEGMLEPSTLARLKSNTMKAAEILQWEKESLPYVALIQSLAQTQVRTGVIAGHRETAPEQQLVREQAPPAEAAAAIPKKAMPADAVSDRRRAAKGADLIEENISLRATNEKLKTSYYQAAAANKKLREAIDNSRTVSQFYRDSTSVNHYLRFARYCYERAGDIKAEAYVAHGVEALPAADAVAKAVGGRVYCDVIEMPSFAQRSVTYDLHPTSHSLLDHAFDGYLRVAAGLSTVGWALGDQIRHYGPRVTVIPNYRNRERLQRSTQIREKCGLGSEERLLLASSTISSGLEPVVEALKLLPDKVHLATLGNFFRDYRGRIQAAVARLDVENRVHFFDPVPYDQFATVASGANIGLIAVDPSLMHWQISLPNRLFDCIAAGLPIVTPDVPDIARIVEGRKIGVTLPKSDARSWADAIAAALNDEEALRANVLAVSEELVWESLGDKLHAAYDHAASVTIIGFTDLMGHQRTIRMADTLVQRGVPVTICCPHEGPVPPDEMPGVRIVLTPRPLAVSPATKAPSAPVSKPNGAAAVEPVAEVPAAKANGATAPANGMPVLTLSVSEPLQMPSRAEHASLERLKKEVIELRYKARRYDEVKGELPAWRAKAARYDRLKGKGGQGLLLSLRRSLRLSARDGNGKGTIRGSTPS